MLDTNFYKVTGEKNKIGKIQAANAIHKKLDNVLKICELFIKEIDDSLSYIEERFPIKYDTVSLSLNTYKLQKQLREDIEQREKEQERIQGQHDYAAFVKSINLTIKTMTSLFKAIDKIIDKDNYNNNKPLNFEDSKNKYKTLEVYKEYLSALIKNLKKQIDYNNEQKILQEQKNTNKEEYGETRKQQIEEKTDAKKQNHHQDLDITR